MDGRTLSVPGHAVEICGADLNRYRSAPIELRDRAAGEYEFTGTIFLDHAREWLCSLETIFPLDISPARQGGIQITSRLDSAQPRQSGQCLQGAHPPR